MVIKNTHGCYEIGDTDVAPNVFSCILPCPPSVNASLTIAKGGRRMIKSPTSRAWQKEAIILLRDEVNKTSWQILTEKGIQVTISARINRRRDLGNIEKSVTDAAEQAGVILNDNRVDAIHLYRVDNGVLPNHLKLEIERL